MTGTVGYSNNKLIFNFCKPVEIARYHVFWTKKNEDFEAKL